jgi:phosphatidylglycerophosphate synthase
MNRIAAVVVRESAPLRFAGLDMAARAERVLRRAGITEIHIVEDDRPLADAPFVDLLLVVPERVVVEAAAITDLVRGALRQSEDAAVVVDAAGCSTGLLLLSAEAIERARPVLRLRSALRRLATEAGVGVIRVAPRYIVRINDARDIAAAETAYLSRTNGGDGEGVFTRNIRRVSIPVSRWLLQSDKVTANGVTIAGFACAVAAGACFTIGSYAAGVFGALIYLASMVLDCSDGEVARGTLSDSTFGAWLETITDYLSYFVVLGSIVAGDLRTEGIDHHTAAAAIAASFSTAIVLLVGWLRAQIAALNPGAFDDALAAELKQGTAFQRFAAWGRQLIKRAFFAHLLVFQAVIGHLPALTEIWAIGAVAALVTILAVQAFLVRSVRVQPLRPQFLNP